MPAHSPGRSDLYTCQHHPESETKGITAIQRVFLLDTHALEKSYQLVAKTQPDYIEVLPGVIPHIIAEYLNEPVSRLLRVD